MQTSDQKYIRLPWKDGGRTRAGVDCVGLAVLWLQEHCNFTTQVPAGVSSQEGSATELLKDRTFDEAKLERGDVVFFKNKAGVVRHVAIYLGDGKNLHIIKGCDSRVDNGFKLHRRCGLTPCAAVKPSEAELLAKALSDGLVQWEYVVMIVISIILSVVSALLMPRLARFGNKYGRYGFDALITQTSTEIPLPDLLGGVVVAGNSPYTQLSDKNLSATASSQRANKIIIFGSGPVEDLDLDAGGLKINGLSFQDKYFYNTSGSDGFTLNPEQSKAEAVEGSIGSDVLVPTITWYNGEHGIEVPVDIRAQYDRTFPLYGFSGCCYGVFRLIDSSKFPQFNVTARVKGRKCRTFGESGFITANSNELIEADGSAVRFKLGTDDIAVMNSLEVDGVAYAEISASAQTGNVYYLNRTKGYVEFLTPPTLGAEIALDYDAYVREWTQNPAAHVLYLLTELGRGNGFPENRINFETFYEAAQYFDETVDWPNSDGVISGPRYTTNYAVDFRKPIQEHLRALLDACRSVLFLSGGQFCLKPIQADTSVFSFTETNIIQDSFSAELLDRADRPNRIKAFYHTSDTYQAETEVVREDVAEQLERESRAGNGGVIEENLKFPAVDNQSQAERLAELFLRAQVNSRWRCSLKTDVQGLALEIGDVVDVTHSSQPTWQAKLFRIEDIAHDEDDRLELQLSEYFAALEI